MQLDNKKILIGIGIGIAVAIIIIIVFIAPMLKKAKDDAADKKAEEEALQASEEISAGQTPSVFAEKPYTDNIWRDLQAWFSTPSVYTEILELNDNQIREIWQDWNQRYKAQYSNRTLQNALNAGYVNKFTVEWSQGAEKFVNKLRQIGLP